MGLQSKKAQTEIQKRFRLEVYAQPGFKRLLAERAIREVKLRTAICLQLKGRVFFNPSLVYRHLGKKVVKNNMFFLMQDSR